MWYTNVSYFAGNEGFINGSFCVEDGLFTCVTSYPDIISRLEEDQAAYTDLNGAVVIPGLVDIHIHGANGFDFSDGSKSGLISMAKYLAKCGVTSFMPTSMTLPYNVLGKSFTSAAEAITDHDSNHARIIGIHMEGPFFAESRCGAQNAAHMKLPDAGAVYKLQEECGGLIGIVDVAPELEGAEEFTSEISSMCRVSVAHTDSDYEHAKSVYEAGARHLTHLYNAMPSIHHRGPGVIGAASERDDVMAELICDGLHVHPSAVRMAFKLFPGRICLVSDALRCMGKPDGRYILGDQQTILSDGVARLHNGTIAGATSDIYQDMLNAMEYGISVNDAIMSATINPAKAAGWDDRIGSIEEGKIADFIICDKDFKQKRVFIGGSELPDGEIHGCQR